MPSPTRERGMALFIALLMLAMALAAALGLRAGTRAVALERERVSERALAQAREALMAYAAGHPINASVGPGYLPCPDLDNDGWAESTCGSLSGDTGQEQRLGRLPWKTLGLPDLRDGHGERLWYAVSTKYKGLLNCAASRACVDMSPAAALGTISVRDSSGALMHDGTSTDPALAASGGAIAVVFAPGPPLERGGVAQRRACSVADCDAAGRCLTTPPQATPTCDPANYLDAAPDLRGGGEDNATFVDRSDAAGRPLNRNGFVAGPVTRGNRVLVNDRIAVIGYGDLMPLVMRRVALEVAGCLRFYAARPENAARFPWMAAACADPASVMGDVSGAREGRVPDTPFTATAAAAMLPRWWRTSPRTPEALAELPTQDDACRFAVPPDDAGPVRSASPGTPPDEASTAGRSPSWWTAWKPHVTVSIAPAFTPSGAAAATCGTQQCLDVMDGNGAVVASAKSAIVGVRLSASACALPLAACDAAGCRVSAADVDALAWLP